MADEITSFSASSKLPSSSSTTINASFNNAHHFITIKLSLTNYLFWKTQITPLLEGHNLMGFVDGTHQCPHPIDPDYHLWLQQDKLIMSLLIASLSEDVFPKVIGLETSHDIWTTLEKAFAASPSNTHQPQYHTTPESVQQGDQSITQMDPGLYESVLVGDIDVLRQNEDQLFIQLTPNGNTLLHVLAQCGDSEACVDQILEMHSSTIKHSVLKWKNSKDETALHIAARNGRLNIVRALIKSAKALDREELESAIQIAGEMMRATDQNGDTALHWAVRNKHEEVVTLLVEEGPDFPHPPNKMEETPLYLAVESDIDEMVDKILTSCKSLSYKGPGGRTAMHAAVLFNSRNITKRLLEHNQALTNEVDEFGWSPLHYAARFGYLYRARQLLKADKSAAYIMANKDDNRTPLHVAAWHGKVKVIKEILKHCPDCWEMTTRKGHNILHLAVDYERKEVFNFVISNPWAINLINEKDAEGNTPLHLCGTSRQIYRLLLNSETDKNAFNGKNLTPLDMIENPTSYIFNEPHKRWLLRKTGGRPGLRNMIQRDHHRYRQWKEKITKQERRIPNDLRKQSDTNLIVATLIATVTFAAGFTIPGGYDSNAGPKQGMAVLGRKAAFKAFVVSDTVALISSMLAVFFHFFASKTHIRLRVNGFHFLGSVIIIFAMLSMMIAFMTGLYTVLAPSLGLSIYLSLFIFVCIFILLRVVLLIWWQRKI